MPDQSVLTVTTAYFDALANGDIKGAMSHFDQNVEWHQPGENQFSGVHQGPEAVGALVGGMYEVSGGTFSLQVTGAPMLNGWCVVYPVRFTGEREGRVLDMNGIDLITVDNGKIVAVHLFSEDSAAEDRFWGSGQRAC